MFHPFYIILTDTIVIPTYIIYRVFELKPKLLLHVVPGILKWSLELFRSIGVSTFIASFNYSKRLPGFWQLLLFNTADLSLFFTLTISYISMFCKSGLQKGACFPLKLQYLELILHVDDRLSLIHYKLDSIPHLQLLHSGLFYKSVHIQV